MTGSREPRLENAAKLVRQAMLLSVVTPCQSSGRPDDWFPGPQDRAAIRRAKAGCRRCPITEACGEWALDNVEQGIWGGMTKADRRAEVRRRARRKAAAA